MQPKSIKFLENDNIEMAFTSKIMTSYGGFSILAKLFEKIKFKEAISSMIPIEELSPNSKGIYSKILKFGLTVLAGGNRFAHSVFLGDSDEIYEELFGVKKMVKSATAITRLFNKIQTQKLATKLSEKLWEYTFDKIIPFSKMREDFLNFDSKVITRYGKQEGVEKGYNPKKRGRPSHHPIIAFLNKNKYIVNLWNRDGSSKSSNGILEFAKETLAKLNGRLSILGCIADTAFYVIDFIKYLEVREIIYIIGVPFQEIIQIQVSKIKEWTRVDKGIEIAEFKFQHKDKKWDKERRYILVRQEKEVLEVARGRQLNLFKEDQEMMKYRFGCYITSLEEDAVEIWRKYRLRAGDENIIKENTYDFGLEGFALDSFYATEAAMLVRTLFYNIINFFRREILPEVERGETLNTLRYKYFVIPAQLGRDGRKFILRMGVRSRELRQKILWIFNKIDLLFSKDSNCNAFGPAG